MGPHPFVSDDMARLVDSEVKALIDEARERCRTLLTEHIDMLHAIAHALLERETITGEDIDILMKGEKLPPFQLEGQNAGEFHLEEDHSDASEAKADNAKSGENKAAAGNAGNTDDATPPAQTSAAKDAEKTVNGDSASSRRRNRQGRQVNGQDGLDASQRGIQPCFRRKTGRYAVTLHPVGRGERNARLLSTEAGTLRLKARFPTRDASPQTEPECLISAGLPRVREAQDVPRTTK